jgi:hypothetical protein
MISGEIRVLRFNGAQSGAKPVTTHLRIETTAQLLVIHEQMPQDSVVVGNAGIGTHYLDLLDIAPSEERSNGLQNLPTRMLPVARAFDASQARQTLSG